MKTNDTKSTNKATKTNMASAYLQAMNTEPDSLVADMAMIAINSSAVLNSTSTYFLDSYFLLRWSPKHFYRAVKDGCVKYKGVSYRLVTPDIEDDTRLIVDVFLSFRQPKKGYGDPVVFAAPWIGGGSHVRK